MDIKNLEQSEMDVSQRQNITIITDGMENLTLLDTPKNENYATLYPQFSDILKKAFLLQRGTIDLGGGLASLVQISLKYSMLAPRWSKFPYLVNPLPRNLKVMIFTKTHQLILGPLGAWFEPVDESLDSNLVAELLRDSAGPRSFLAAADPCDAWQRLINVEANAVQEIAERNQLTLEISAIYPLDKYPNYAGNTFDHSYGRIVFGSLQGTSCAATENNVMDYEIYIALEDIVSGPLTYPL